MVCDMTQGKPGGILWRYSMPILLSVAFQQLYNIVDSIVAGQFVGEQALAAVGASYPITMIFMAVAAGLNVGCSVVIAQLFGAKRMTEMKTSVHTSLVLVAAVSLLFTALGAVLCRPIMRMLKTPQDVFADSTLYLDIYIYGLFFLFLYNICTGIFTALGDSRTPLIFLIFSSLGNIALDIWFVAQFKMGVAGVAWATFAAQGVSSLLAFGVLMKRLRGISAEEKPKWFSFPMLGKICTLAVPSILQQSFVSVGNLFIQWLVNGYGSSVLAGYSSAVKLNTFAITSFTALANGMSNFTAQNMGAGLTERVRRGLRAAIMMGICVALPFIALYAGFGRAMIHLFMSEPSEEAVRVGVLFLRIVSPFYLAIMVKLMMDSVLRGAGAVFYFTVSTFSDLLLRVVLAFVLSAFFASTGIWMSWPFGWMIAMLLSSAFYWKGSWKNKTVLQ